MNLQKKSIETDPIDEAQAVRISKSRAQRCLRRAFLEARFQTVASPEGADPAHETWQVWCKGGGGRMTALVEVTGPRAVLPFAAMRECFKRIGRDIVLNIKDGTIEAVPMKLKLRAGGEVADAAGHKPAVEGPRT